MNNQPTDFWTLRAGQNDPYLNKFIRVIIIQDTNYIVYLDNDLNVQWNVNNDLITPKLGKILNQVAILEAKSDFIKPDKRLIIISKLMGKRSHEFVNFFCDPSLSRIRSLLGESIARIFDGNDNEEALIALREAEKLISAKNAEYARGWYYQHANNFAILAIVMAVCLWLVRDFLTSYLGETSFEVLFCSLFGAVGAFVFIARRGQKIELDAISGARVHRIEANARMATGMVAAALVDLAIKSGFLFSSISSAAQLKFMVMGSILAGYSERFIPNMVKKLQDTSAESDDKNEIGNS
jgi:hypothetical protein